MVSRVEFDARADGTTPDREDLDERGAKERERERESAYPAFVGPCCATVIALLRSRNRKQ